MKIKLFIIYHKGIPLPDIPTLIPIRSDRIDGDNISHQENYCELRAHYWVWKNGQLKPDDYVGFFHYRRYLKFYTKKAAPSQKKAGRRPYRILKWPNSHWYDEDRLNDFVRHYDALAPVWEYAGLTVWKRYASGGGQREEDLRLIYEIIVEKYPDYQQAANMYLSGKGEYYGNIYVLRQDLFASYCHWLFSILSEFDHRVSDPPPRTNGYLGERLFGIYFTWLQLQPNMRLGELPRVHFYGYDDDGHSFIKDKVLNHLLPPGSRWRGFVRKLQYIKESRR